MNKPTSAIMQLLITICAIAIVTAAHFYWRAIRINTPERVLPVYCVTWCLFVLCGYLIVLRAGRHSYQRHHRLGSVTLFLASTVWGTFFAIPSLYSPSNWAWSWSNGVSVSFNVRLLSGLFVAIGLLGIVASFAWLGISRSMGQESNILRTAGAYRYTRNPQMVGVLSIVIGYTILRPTWYAAGWIILFIILAHLMIAAEEEHLNRIFGKDYESYCTRTPRYVGWLGPGKGSG